MVAVPAVNQSSQPTTPEKSSRKSFI